MSETLIVYGSPTCLMVLPVKGMLHRAKAPFEYIDISRDSGGRRRVQEINNGYESVPTLVFADGSTLTEPSRGELRNKLEQLGYVIARPNAWQALKEKPIILILGLLFLTLGLVSGEWWLAGISIVALALSVAYSWFT